MGGGDDSITAAHSGRGGAGNIQPKSPQVDPSSLHTPTLKQATYTTGRGGSGNMAHNDPSRPELARAAQDVDAPAAAELRTSSDGAFHTGRGGAANVVRSPADEEDGGQRDRSKSRERKGESIVERGKEMLGLKK